MTGQLRILLFGGLRVDQAGRVITRFQTRQTGALLAYLAFHRDRSHPRDLLSETLWPEDPPEVARRKLRIALASLRRQFEPHGVPAGGIFLAERHFLQLDPRAYTTDVLEFERALEAAARASGGLQRIRLLEQAAELYGGELLPGYFEEWILPERLRLAERYQEALQQLAAELKQAGDLTRALHWARRAVEVDPLREEAHHDLMQLLVDAGQPEAAVRAYARLEQLLQVELGRTPGPINRQLAGTAGAPAPPSVQRIQSAVKLPGSNGPAAPLGRQPGSLPGPDSSPRPDLLAGTVTLLLANLEAPTDPAAPGGPQALRKTDLDLLRSIFQSHGGQEVRGAGDALLVVFRRAADALAAAIDVQEALEGSRRSPEPEHRTDLRAEDSPGAAGLRHRVRIGVHTGDAEFREGQCHGPILHHLTRLTSAAHAGQILISEAAAAVARPNLDAELRLRDLGLFRLRPGAPPEHLFEASSGKLGERQFPPPQAPRADLGYLPTPLTRFFGREAEIAALRQWLLVANTRLVTLTGPPGVGKTRLALALAAELQAGGAEGAGCPPKAGEGPGAWFDRAIWFLPLADVANPRLIVDRLADLLGWPRTPGTEPLECVIEVLSRQRALLVVDNLEHLADEGAAVLQTLLERVPSLTCLVTSRRRLDLYGEREYSVSPLPLPAAGEGRATAGPSQGAAHRRAALEAPPLALVSCASVQLFIDRTQAVRPDFRLTSANAAVVAELCRRLEGIPLALELAAARAQVLTPAQVLAQLESRFELLFSRRRGLPARHQTLRAALDWSYQLLSPELQRFFARLFVFRGGFTVEAADAVCNLASDIQQREDRLPEAIDHLDQLRSRSLLDAEECSSGMRYRMLESVREYAAEQLAPEERAETASRHAQFFLALAERAEPELSGPAQASWLNRLEEEHANLRAALDWCAEPADHDAQISDAAGRNRSEIALRFIAALWWFWTVHGHWNEGEEYCRRIVAMPGRPAPTPARARSLDRAARMVRDPELIQALLAEALEIYQELGARGPMTGPLNSLGHLACSRGDYSRGRLLYERCEAIYAEVGNQWGVAMASANQGKAAYYEGDNGSARSFQEQSLAIMRAQKDDWHVAYALVNLGLIAYSEHRWEEATARYAEALQVLQAVEGQSLILEALEGLGVIADAAAAPERAARLLAAADALRAALGAPPAEPTDPGYSRYPAHALARRYAEDHPAAWAQGHQMSLEQIVAYALEGTESGNP